jgi:hypothetical protein
MFLITTEAMLQHKSKEELNLPQIPLHFYSPQKTALSCQLFIFNITIHIYINIYMIYDLVLITKNSNNIHSAVYLTLSTS